MPTKLIQPINCLECDTLYVPKTCKNKFCSKNCGSKWRQKNVYGSEYQNKCRSSSPEKFMNSLLTYYGRRKIIRPEVMYAMYEKQGKKCALSGIEMTYVLGKGYIPTNISIDRIDSSKSYSEDNIQLVCRAVNEMKRALTVEEFLLFCESVTNFNNKPKD